MRQLKNTLARYYELRGRRPKAIRELFLLYRYAKRWFSPRCHSDPNCHVASNNGPCVEMKHLREAWCHQMEAEEGWSLSTHNSMLMSMSPRHGLEDKSDEEEKKSKTSKNGKDHTKGGKKPKLQAAALGEGSALPFRDVMLQESRKAPGTSPLLPIYPLRRGREGTFVVLSDSRCGY